MSTVIVGAKPVTRTTLLPTGAGRGQLRAGRGPRRRAGSARSVAEEGHIEDDGHRGYEVSDDAGAGWSLSGD